MQANGVHVQESRRHHLRAVSLAFFVTILWASSWVIIKFGLEEIPPLTFAALRYSIASVLLLGFAFARQDGRQQVRNRSRRWWITLVAYGLIFITATQGAQFLALYFLPAIALSLMLNLTPIVVVLVSVPLLREIPSRAEGMFIMLGLVGVFLYFFPLELLGLPLLGLLIGIGALSSNSASAILGRAINRDGNTPYLIVTTVSMSFGSFALLVAALLVEGVTIISALSLLYILWLSIVNTAIAFTLWNRAMGTLRAVDMTLINSTMMPQIVLLSLVFLGEYPTGRQWMGLLILGFSVMAVQLLQVYRREKPPVDSLGKG